jgi:hypothetical protein
VVETDCFPLTVHNPHKYLAPPFLQACDLLCPDENDPLDLKRAPLASDVFTKCLNLALRNERAKEALIIATKGAATVKAQNLTSSLYKLYATQTILQLYLGDVVAADKTFMEVRAHFAYFVCERGLLHPCDSTV